MAPLALSSSITRSVHLCSPTARSHLPHLPLSHANTAPLTLTHSESGSAPHADSDAEAADNHRTSTFRLHEGTANPSRADNVDDLHRLQKSVTKARHDGERWRERERERARLGAAGR